MRTQKIGTPLYKDECIGPVDATFWNHKTFLFVARLAGGWPSGEKLRLLRTGPQKLGGGLT